jgi:hypothetical protein
MISSSRVKCSLAAAISRSTTFREIDTVLVWGQSVTDLLATSRK